MTSPRAGILFYLHKNTLTSVVVAVKRSREKSECTYLQGSSIYKILAGILLRKTALTRSAYANDLSGGQLYALYMVDT